MGLAKGDLKVELKLICSRSCDICPPTPAPTEEPTMEPSASPTTSVCDDYDFNYEDRVTGETASSCADLSDLKQASRNRACKKKFPSGKGGKVELKLICSRSCGICPPT